MLKTDAILLLLLLKRVRVAKARIFGIKSSRRYCEAEDGLHDTRVGTLRLLPIIP